MLVSVIIPIYNEKNTIKSTLESFINQKGIIKDDYEIIVVDGNSTDDSVSLIKELIEENNFIKLIKNDKRFMPYGFNIGLSNSSGKYVMVASGHCLVEENYLRNAISLVKEKEVECVSGVMTTVQDNNIGKIISVAQSTFFGVGNAAFRINLDNGTYVDTGVFGFYISDIFKKVGGMDEELIRNQDEEFNFRLIQNNGRIWLDPKLKSKYYSRSSFLKLFIQYFQYGFFKIRVMQKRINFISIRHLIPLAFILALLGSSVYVLKFNRLLPLILLFVSYASASIFFTIKQIVITKNLKLHYYLLPFAYAMMHFGYGIGSLLGFFYYIHKWKDKDIIDKHFNRSQFVKNRL